MYHEGGGQAVQMARAITSHHTNSHGECVSAGPRSAGEGNCFFFGLGVLSSRFQGFQGFFPKVVGLMVLAWSTSCPAPWFKDGARASQR